MDFLFFSAETEPPAGYYLMQISNPVEKLFNNLHKAAEYTDELDSIGIVFICVSNKSLNNGIGRERKYVSHKKRYADIRLQISYDEFLQAHNEKRKYMCKRCIEKAINIIATRVDDFKSEQLIADIVELFD